ncbi:MAG TPA: hypothetical protein VF699_04390 [Caulobacteraceae bacterium]|jgi:hypothetical protein
MAPRLKVFCTTNGLTQYVVATSSKAKALAAWGTTRDLFKDGIASETNEAALVEAALAQPGEVVTRSAVDLAALEAAVGPPKKKGKGKGGKAEAKKPKGPSPEALERVEKFERKLAEHDARHKEALSDIAERRAELDAEETALRGAYASKRRDLQQRLSDARERVAAESR